LEPHAADQDPDQPDSKMSAGALRGILLPIPQGHCNAGKQQRPEQRQDEIVPVSQTEMITRRPNQELPDIGDGIFGHALLQTIEWLLDLSVS
jgi:hypothetical protein